ncbi:MAG: hypothetical protein IJ835_00490 [Muribaculaceae bacterium]|nr:hypothetical protein [Muribaculaceae bacterium]
MKISNILLAVAVAAITAIGLEAQNAVTPYSRIAYGILNDNLTGIQRSMGGVGIAMQNGRQINVVNPASYSQVDSLTFLWDVGTHLSFNWSQENGKRGRTIGGGLDYLTGEFRIARGLGGAFGLVPYSSVGYTFGGKIDNGKETRVGSGGLSELFVGFGYEPVKGLSIGANVSYLFGTITNETQIATASTSQFQRVTEVRDWNIKVGLQYGVNVTPKDRLVLGFTYQPKKYYHGHAWGTYYDIANDTKADTVGFCPLKGNYEQAAGYGAGLSYTRDNRLTLEADFLYQQWSKAKYRAITGYEADDMTFDDRWKASFGISYTPDPRGNYLNRMTYRIGGFYNHDYINVRDNNVRDYGIGLGFSFPALGGKTLVNLGFEWRHRYSAPVLYIKEDILNITLSVNFNELWFWKNKIR